jgi:hypothetical protein
VHAQCSCLWFELPSNVVHEALHRLFPCSMQLTVAAGASGQLRRQHMALFATLPFCVVCLGHP